MVVVKEKNLKIPQYDNEDKKLSLFVVAYYFVQALNLSVKTMLPISDSLWSALSNGFMGILLVLMLATIAPVLKRSFMPFLMTEIVFVLVYVVSYFQGNADESILLSYGFQTLCICIPLAFYVYSMKNKKIFYDMVLKSSYLLIILLSYVLIIGVGNSNVVTYSMSASYAVLLPTLFQINEYFKTWKKINLISFLIPIVAIFLFGARGPLICVAVMLLFKVLFDMKKSALKICALLIGFLIIGLFVLYAEQISNALLSFFSNRGIYSRTLTIIVNETLTESTGRNMLRSYYWILIEEKAFGWGILGGWIGSGNYPHNIFVEYLLAFGYAIGGILCFSSSGLMFKVFWVKDEMLRQLIIIFCSYSLQLFLSGSFLDSPHWFIFVVLCFSERRFRPAKKWRNFENRFFHKKDFTL